VHPAAIVVIVIVAIVVALFAGGMVAVARRRRERGSAFRTEVERANGALAAARAEDRGWDPELLESAARAACARRGASTLRSLHLIQVVDRPGTEHDEARFRGIDDRGVAHDVLLRRSGEGWESEG
jgi:type II secretory pathway pseudopilin PulG